MHILTVTQGTSARGKLGFEAKLGEPLVGHLVISFDPELDAELERIAEVDEGPLWTPRRSYTAPLDLHQWAELGAALMELRRRHRSIEYSWSSVPTDAELAAGDDPTPDPPGVIY